MTVFFAPVFGFFVSVLELFISVDSEPAGVLSTAHFLCATLAFLCLYASLNAVKMGKVNVRRVIRILTVTLWVLEGIKIWVAIKNGGGSINETVPLYFCSIVLYAGVLSGFCGGRARRVGDVFLACGGVVGGVVFLALPLSSFTVYPLFHFITLQSVFLHGCMIFMGLGLVLSNEVEIKKRDIIYYLPCVSAVCLAAFIINSIYGSNLMFISQNYPSTPIEILYNLCPNGLFTVVTVAGQLFLPFYGMYYVYHLAKRRETKKMKNVLQ